MSEHTPTPWKACKNGECTCGMVWSIPGDFPVCTANGSSTFPTFVMHEHMADSPELIYQSITPEICKANVLFVVKAVNSHAALVEALKQMVEEKADYMTLNHLGDPETQHTVKVARAALALAGEAP